MLLSVRQSSWVSTVVLWQRFASRVCPTKKKFPARCFCWVPPQYYRDNYPARNPEEARKVLEKAGYTKSGDFYAKDGKTITLKLTTFGDDATTKGQAQTFIQSMKEIGINFELDSRAQSEFSRCW